MTPDRSAETGEYVSAETAAANPATTVHETEKARGPRAPDVRGGKDKILRVANYLRDGGPDWDDAREVAEMLEDIAEGKWSLSAAFR